MRWLLIVLVALSNFALAQVEQNEPTHGLEVSLLTFGPGEIYWERFGHNAIVIRDRGTGRAISYNYGIFDFEEDDFFSNFLRGHMRYQIAANDAADDIAIYAGEGRSVTEQTLNFTQAQARTLLDHLEWNLRPENIHYRYDYFTSNCSTKVRDALDLALGGILHQQLISPSRGYTYRLMAGALTSPDPPLMGAIDIGLGPFADRRLPFWDDSFVPMALMSHLRNVQIKSDDGSNTSLVREERILSPSRFSAPPDLPPDFRWPFFAIGIAFAALLLFLRSQSKHAWAKRSFATLAVVLSLTCTAIGLILLGLWGFTDHQSAWRNENLLVFSPLCLLLIPTWWRSAAADFMPSRTAVSIALMIALLCGLGLFGKVLPWFVQANLPWILLLLPSHLVLATALYQRRQL